MRQQNNRKYTLEVFSLGRRFQVSLNRPKNVWQWSFYVNGDRHRGSTFHEDLPGAKIFANGQALKILETYEITGHTPLLHAYERYLKRRWPDPDNANRSYNDAKNRLKAFVDKNLELDLANSPLDDITDAVQEFLDGRRGTCSARTIINDQRVISRFFSWCLKNIRRKIGFRTNPAAMALLDLDPPERNITRPLTRIECELLLRQTRRSDVWAPVLLCLTAGFRPIGTIRAEWQDVNWEAKTIRVYEKRYKTDVPLNDWVMDELKHLHKTRGNSTKIVQISQDVVYKRLRKLRDAAGLGPEATLQGLRRTFISILLDGGENMENVAARARNSVKVIEQHYRQQMIRSGHDILKQLDFRKELDK